MRRARTLEEQECYLFDKLKECPIVFRTMYHFTNLVQQNQLILIDVSAVRIVGFLFFAGAYMRQRKPKNQRYVLRQHQLSSVGSDEPN